MFLIGGLHGDWILFHGWGGVGVSESEYVRGKKGEQRHEKCSVPNSMSADAMKDAAGFEEAFDGVVER